jgi:hypothetical protein
MNAIFNPELSLMKNVFALFLLLPFFSFAQDCKLKKSVDPFTHEVKLSTGFQNFTGNGITISISADATAKEIDFFVWIKGDNKCFDAESIANVVFEGERSRTTLRNAGSMNCDGAFHFIFKNTPVTPSWLNRMATKKIATIKLTGTDKKEITLAFSEDQKNLFQSMANCMATEGKTLLPQ